MKSRVTGMNRSGLSEAVKMTSEQSDFTQTTFPEHMLLEKRIGGDKLVENLGYGFR